MSNKKESVSLKTVVGGLIQALSQAKYLGDAESAKLFDVYKNKKEWPLSSFTVPAFTISDVDIELRFSIVESSEEHEKGKTPIPNLKINISPEFLKGLEAHQVNVMKLKISPVNLRVFEESK